MYHVFQERYSTAKNLCKVILFLGTNVCKVMLVLLCFSLPYFPPSDLREVPDNQEVFVHPHTDQSIILEILEYVPEIDDTALRY